MSCQLGKNALTCPSAPPEQGSVLLGIVAAPGEIVYITPNPPVTGEMLSNFEKNGIVPENRLRFAGPCMEHRCLQWAGTRCGLIDRVVDHFGPADGEDALPKCGIRNTCRWFAQQGRAACEACPEIIRKPEEASLRPVPAE
jgi:hypothetical protein